MKYCFYHLPTRFIIDESEIKSYKNLQDIF